jgi:hypothetical protein
LVEELLADVPLEDDEVSLEFDEVPFCEAPEEEFVD